MKSRTMLFFIGAIICVSISEIAHCETEIFPLRRALHYQYSYQRSTSLVESGTSQSWTSDSGLVQYTVLDSIQIDDTTCSWHVHQSYRLLHRYHDSVRDSLYWRQDSTDLELRENTTGRHELSISGIVWSFPVMNYYILNQPVLRYADTSNSLIVLHWLPPGTFGVGDDTLWFSSGLGFYKRRYNSTSGGGLSRGSMHLAIDLISLTSVEKTAVEGKPQQIVLSQNFPNPFNPTTKIQYQLSHRVTVDVSVFDVLGRKISSLVSEVKDPGLHEIIFEAHDFVSGVYICRLQWPSGQVSKQMILLR